MRRRKPPAPPPVEGVPPLLALGRCIELYDGDALTAFRAWDEARDAWAEERGVDPHRNYGQLPDVLHDHAPWSFAELAELDPDRLAAKLARAGLPRDWRPTSLSASVNHAGPRDS